MISRIADNKKGAFRRLAPVVAVVAAAGAAAFVFSNNNVSAAEAHGAVLTATAIGGVQVAQAAGNPTAGNTAFTRCRTCHTVEKGEPNRVGPNLFGIVGKSSATTAGFNYSDAMKNAKITWDEATLVKYILDAPGTVPGNKMNLAKGAVNATAAADIVAFLNTKK